MLDETVIQIEQTASTDINATQSNVIMNTEDIMTLFHVFKISYHVSSPKILSVIFLWVLDTKKRSLPSVTLHMTMLPLGTN